ncbi:electron transport complex subunit RsxD [Kaarinaea lacus]
MNLKTPSSPHIHADITVASMMSRVILALVPALIAYVYFFGWGLLIHIAIAISVGLGCEAAMLKLRQRPIKPFLSDGSVLVTSLLLCFCIPPLSPWWITVIGVAFAVVVAKQLYGGLGYNPFNPAMVGYIVLLISFPKEMTSWVPPNILNGLQVNFIDTLTIVFLGDFPYTLSIDALSMATPLDMVKAELGLSKTVDEIKSGNAIFGDFGGVGWEWIGNWIFLGGVWLIYKKIINWHVPVAMLGSLFTIALIFYLKDASNYASPMFHIFSGAAMLGAFFIATDPVSGCTTPAGRIVFGIGVGVLTYVIRVWGGYPDGVGFAILLMNMAAPTIDYYTQPRVYGHPKG